MTREEIVKLDAGGELWIAFAPTAELAICRAVLIIEMGLQ